MVADTIALDREDERSALQFPSLLDEREAAKVLRVKPATVRAERMRGNLGYTKIGPRIFYTHQQIADYLQRQTVPACVSNPSNALAKSEATGSAKSRDKTVQTEAGAGPGMTNERDKHAVSALAQQIFKRRASVSPRG